MYPVTTKTFKMKDRKMALGHFIVAATFAGIGFAWWIINREPKHKIFYDTEYKNGEILYPDYAHSDTLTVIDADGLNKAATYWDGSDSEINEALHQFCK